MVTAPQPEPDSGTEAVTVLVLDDRAGVGMEMSVHRVRAATKPNFGVQEWSQNGHELRGNGVIVRTPRYGYSIQGARRRHIRYWMIRGSAHMGYF